MPRTRTQRERERERERGRERRETLCYMYSNDIRNYRKRYSKIFTVFQRKLRFGISHEVPSDFLVVTCPLTDNRLVSYFSSADASCFCRWTCGPYRKFSMDVFTTQNDQVLHFHRTCCRCDCCCCLDCFMCLQKLYVVDCLGRTLGAIKQRYCLLVCMSPIFAEWTLLPQFFGKLRFQQKGCLFIIPVFYRNSLQNTPIQID